jgi:hypothetical protein
MRTNDTIPTDEVLQDIADTDDLSEGWMPGDWSRPTKAQSVPKRAE